MDPEREREHPGGRNRKGKRKRGIYQPYRRDGRKKSYNKLYGRIRRGKVPSDTPLMDELKRLHDEYTEKYENTHQKDREAVWKEYIQKNKELLG